MGHEMQSPIGFASSERSKQMTNPLITAALAMPKTHKVVVTYEDGTTHVHATRNEASAQNYAAHMRFRFGKTATVEVIPISS